MANLAEDLVGGHHRRRPPRRCVGAYYHDLGKTVQPKYFRGEPSARRAHPRTTTSRPGVLRRRHHGPRGDGREDPPPPGRASPSRGRVRLHATTAHQVVEFFWYRVQGGPANPKGLTQEHFRYPGHEAADQGDGHPHAGRLHRGREPHHLPSRAEEVRGDDPTRHASPRLLAAGQLDESGAHPWKTCGIITSRIAPRLVNMYHGRIKYPRGRRGRPSPAPPPPLPLRPLRPVARRPRPPPDEAPVTVTPRRAWRSEAEDAEPKARPEAKTESAPDRRSRSSRSSRPIEARRLHGPRSAAAGAAFRRRRDPVPPPTVAIDACNREGPAR